MYMYMYFVCCIMYCCRFFGHIMYTAYLNAMMTAFLTFVLRLYRRKSDNHVCVCACVCVCVCACGPCVRVWPVCVCARVARACVCVVCVLCTRYLYHIKYTLYYSFPLLSLPLPFAFLSSLPLSHQISLVSREMYNLLTTEDSSHYMFYTVFFYNQQPAPSESLGEGRSSKKETIRDLLLTLTSDWLRVIYILHHTSLQSACYKLHVHFFSGVTHCFCSCIYNVHIHVYMECSCVLILHMYTCYMHGRVHCVHIVLYTYLVYTATL